MHSTAFLVIFHLAIGFSLASQREYHYVALKKSWFDAQRYCREKYADLATFDSMADLDRLNQPPLGSITNYTWIGLSDDPASWQGTMGGDANSWRWSATGETSTTAYQNWASGEPDFLQAKETCVMATPDGSWKDAECDQPLPAICYTASSPHGQKTYSLVPGTRTWDEAKSFCQTHHTDLAVIESHSENMAMMAAKAQSSAWIGLYRIPHRWSDGSSSSFTNWRAGQPMNKNGRQACVNENADHQWSDATCTHDYSFICQGGLKVKKFGVSMTIQSDADLSDANINGQLARQVDQLMTNQGVTDFKIKWKIQRNVDTKKK